jgi:putative intracellular protease/amidase
MSNERAVHVMVFDGFADWEPAHALAELRRWGGRTVRSVGFNHEPVTSMGGLRVTPDVDVASVEPADVELFIVPGGTLWERDDYARAPLEALLTNLVHAGTPVAAICAATLALGRAGILDDHRHTSNARSYLPAHVHGYAGEDHYVDVPVVADRHVITASGAAAVDFARAIFADLGVASDDERSMWFELFKHGRLPEAFAAPVADRAR